MENFVSLLNGFQVALAPENIAVCLLGAVLGLVVGAMPGIGSLAGCALLLPLTYKFNPTTAIIMLGALYYSNMYGGSFSAILLNIPGDSPAITTALDGYPMARKGRPGQALMTANLASFIGGTIGILILTGIHDARLGGVADDKAQGFNPRQLQIALEILIRLHHGAHGADDPAFLHIALLLPAPQQHGIQAILLPQRLTGAFFPGLDDGYAQVAALSIQPIQHFIGKGAQKIAFAKLQHPDMLRSCAAARRFFIQSFQSARLRVYIFSLFYQKRRKK